MKKRKIIKTVTGVMAHLNLVGNKISPSFYHPVLIEGLPDADQVPDQTADRLHLIAEEALRAAYARERRRCRPAFWAMLFVCVVIAAGGWFAYHFGAPMEWPALGLDLG